MLRIVDGKLPVAVKYMTNEKSTAVRSEIRSVRSTATSSGPCPRARCLVLPPPQLRRINNEHPHIVQSYGYLRGASGSLYMFLECGTADGHDAAGWAPSGDRRLGSGTHIREWMLQLAHGT